MNFLRKFTRANARRKAADKRRMEKNVKLEQLEPRLLLSATPIDEATAFKNGFAQLQGQMVSVVNAEDSLLNSNMPFLKGSRADDAGNLEFFAPTMRELFNFSVSDILEENSEELENGTKTEKSVLGEFSELYDEDDTSSSRTTLDLFSGTDSIFMNSLSTIFNNAVESVDFAKADAYDMLISALDSSLDLNYNTHVVDENIPDAKPEGISLTTTATQVGTTDAEKAIQLDFHFDVVKDYSMDVGIEEGYRAFNFSLDDVILQATASFDFSAQIGVVTSGEELTTDDLFFAVTNLEAGIDVTAGAGSTMFDLGVVAITLKGDGFTFDAGVKANGDNNMGYTAATGSASPVGVNDPTSAFKLGFNSSLGTTQYGRFTADSDFSLTSTPQDASFTLRVGTSDTVTVATTDLSSNGINEAVSEISSELSSAFYATTNDDDRLEIVLHKSTLDQFNFASSFTLNSETVGVPTSLTSSAIDVTAVPETLQFTYSTDHGVAQLFTMDTAGYDFSTQAGWNSFKSALNTKLAIEKVGITADVGTLADHDIELAPGVFDTRPANTLTFSLDGEAKLVEFAHQNIILDSKLNSSDFADATFNLQAIHSVEGNISDLAWDVWIFSQLDNVGDTNGDGVIDDKDDKSLAITIGEAIAGLNRSTGKIGDFTISSEKTDLILGSIFDGDGLQTIGEIQGDDFDGYSFDKDRIDYSQLFDSSMIDLDFLDEFKEFAEVATVSAQAITEQLGQLGEWAGKMKHVDGLSNIGLGFLQDGVSDIMAFEKFINGTFLNDLIDESGTAAFDTLQDLSALFEKGMSKTVYGVQPVSKDILTRPFSFVLDGVTVEVKDESEERDAANSDIIVKQAVVLGDNKNVDALVEDINKTLWNMKQEDKLDSDVVVSHTDGILRFDSKTASFTVKFDGVTGYELGMTSELNTTKTVEGTGKQRVNTGKAVVGDVVDLSAAQDSTLTLFIENEDGGDPIEVSIEVDAADGADNETLVQKINSELANNENTEGFTASVNPNEETGETLLKISGPKKFYVNGGQDTGWLGYEHDEYRWSHWIYDKVNRVLTSSATEIDFLDDDDGNPMVKSLPLHLQETLFNNGVVSLGELSSNSELFMTLKGKLRFEFGIDLTSGGKLEDSTTLGEFNVFKDLVEDDTTNIADTILSKSAISSNVLISSGIIGKDLVNGVQKDNYNTKFSIVSDYKMTLSLDDTKIPNKDAFVTDINDLLEADGIFDATTAVTAESATNTVTITAPVGVNGDALNSFTNSLMTLISTVEDENEGLQVGFDIEEIGTEVEINNASVNTSFTDLKNDVNVGLASAGLGTQFQAVVVGNRLQLERIGTNVSERFIVRSESGSVAIRDLGMNGASGMVFEELEDEGHIVNSTLTISYYDESRGSVVEDIITVVATPSNHKAETKHDVVERVIEQLDQGRNSKLLVSKLGFSAALTEDNRLIITAPIAFTITGGTGIFANGTQTFIAEKDVTVGRLSEDVKLNVTLGVEETEVTILASDTVSNSSIYDLADDLRAAFQAAGIDTAGVYDGNTQVTPPEVDISVDSGKLVFRRAVDALLKIENAEPANTYGFAQLGLSAETVANTYDLKITFADGTYSFIDFSDAEFNISETTSIKDFMDTLCTKTGNRLGYALNAGNIDLTDASFQDDQPNLGQFRFDALNKSAFARRMGFDNVDVEHEGKIVIQEVVGKTLAERIFVGALAFEGTVDFDDGNVVINQGTTVLNEGEANEEEIHSGLWVQEFKNAETRLTFDGADIETLKKARRGQKLKIDGNERRIIDVDIIYEKSQFGRIQKDPDTGEKVIKAIEISVEDLFTDGTGAVLNSGAVAGTLTYGTTDANSKELTTGIIKKVDGETIFSLYEQSVRSGGTAVLKQAYASLLNPVLEGRMINLKASAASVEPNWFRINAIDVENATITVDGIAEQEGGDSFSVNDFVSQAVIAGLQIDATVGPFSAQLLGTTDFGFKVNIDFIDDTYNMRELAERTFGAKAGIFGSSLNFFTENCNVALTAQNDNNGDGYLTGADSQILFDVVFDSMGLSDEFDDLGITARLNGINFDTSTFPRPRNDASADEEIAPPPAAMMMSMAASADEEEPSVIPFSFSFDEESMGSLANIIKNFSIDDIFSSFEDFFEKLTAMTASFDAFNTQIPFINKSINEMIDIAGDMQEAFNGIKQDPGMGLQLLEDRVEEIFGLTEDDFVVKFIDPLNSGYYNEIEFNLDYAAAFQNIYALEFGFGGNAGLDDLFGGKFDFGLSGAADIIAKGLMLANLDFTVSAEFSGEAKAVTVKVLETTGVHAELEIKGEDLAFNAGMGPLGLFVREDRLNESFIELNGEISVGLDKEFSVELGTDGFNVSDLDIGVITDIEVGGQLPVYFPTDTNYVGNIIFGTWNAADDKTEHTRLGEDHDGGKITELEQLKNFAIRAKKENTDYVDDSLILDVSDIVEGIEAEIGDLLDIDFSKLNLFDKINLAIDGLDLVLGQLDWDLNSKLGSIDFPVIGGLFDGGINFLNDFRLNFLDDFRKFAFGGFDIDLNTIGNFLLRKFGGWEGSWGNFEFGGLDLLREFNFNQWGLGDGFEFDPRLGWDFAQGFGVNLPEFDFNLPGIVMKSNLDFEDIVANQYAEWYFNIGGKEVIDNEFGFDLGFPGLGLDLDADLEVVVDWSLALGFGFDFTNGFYIILPEGNELQATVEVTVDGEMVGSLGFLEASAVANKDNISMGVGLGLDIDTGKDNIHNANTDILSFNNISSIAQNSSIKLGAFVDIDLPLTVGILNDTGSGEPNFPNITSDFQFNWSISEEGTSIDKENFGQSELWYEIPFGGGRGELDLTPDYLAFSDISFNAGEYINNVIGPLLGKIQEVTEPMMPIIEFLTTPMPVLKDLGLIMTPLDLAESIMPKEKVDIGMIRSVADIITMVDTIAGLAKGDDLDISYVLGSLVIINPDGETGLIGGDGFGGFNPFGDNAGGEAYISGNSTVETVSSSDVAGYTPEKDPDSKGNEGVLGGLKSKLADTGWEIPFLTDPTATVINLIMGKDVNLVTYDMDSLGVELAWSQSFNIIGPLAIGVGVEIGVEIDLAFGYDTMGIRQFIEGDFKNPGLLINGFFIDDLKDGQDVDELIMYGGLWAGVELNVGFAKAGVGGGVNLTVGFDLYDPDRDGKIRLYEMAENFRNEWEYGSKALAPLAVFDIHGEITAELFAYLKIKLGFFKWEKSWTITGPITIAEFDINFDRPPVLASEVGDSKDPDVILHTGDDASLRMNGSLIDNDEHFTVRMDGNDAYVSSSSHPAREQKYTLGSTGKLIIDGGKGNDKFTITGKTDRDILIFGGEGNDTIDMNKLEEAGTVKVYGGLGNDHITGSDGKDILFGGLGNDYIDGHGDNDIIFGDDAEIRATTAVALFKPAEDGDDELIGGDGSDLILGSGGDDRITGGSGNDFLIGDAAVVSFLETGNDFDLGDQTGSIAYETKIRFSEKGEILDKDGNVIDRADLEEEDYIQTTKLAIAKTSLPEGQAGDDTIAGNSGEDYIYGADGNDRLDGGADDDVIFGEFGDDIISGGSGIDTIDGGYGNDIIFGDNVGGDGVNSVTIGSLKTFDESNDQWYQDYSAQNLNNIGFAELNKDITIEDIDTGDSGEAGADIINAGAGQDIVLGDTGLDADTADTKAAREQTGDTIRAGAGNDLIAGESGDDKIYGEDAPDTIFGGSGNDYINGGAGSDIMFGDRLKDFIDEDGNSTLVGLDLKGGNTSRWNTAVYGGNTAEAYGYVFKSIDDAYNDNASIAKATHSDGEGAGADTLVASMGGDFADGQGGSDSYEVKTLGKDAENIINVTDSGLNDDASDRLIVKGSLYDDTFLVRQASKLNIDNNKIEEGLAFVANVTDYTREKYERINYWGWKSGPNSETEKFGINNLSIEGNVGDDAFYIDNTAVTTQIHGQEGADFFQVGQLFRSARDFQGNAHIPTAKDAGGNGIHEEDAFYTEKVTQGWLSGGVDNSTQIFGGDGDDDFTVFRNRAVLSLFGENGDDNFLVQAFVLEDEPGQDENGEEVKKISTDISGGAGDNDIRYAINAPVNINGGAGFDTVTIMGTEENDHFVVTDEGVFGAGLFVKFVEIEALTLDGAEGDDHFSILSTGDTYATQIFGGKGSDTFEVGGNDEIKTITSQDLRGHSGVVTHSIVNSEGSGYEDIAVSGVSVNVHDATAKIKDTDSYALPSVVLDGAAVRNGLRVTENGEAATYTVRLSQPPVAGYTATVVVKAPRPSDEQLKNKYLLAGVNVAGNDKASISELITKVEETRKALRFGSFRFWRRFSSSRLNAYHDAQKALSDALKGNATDVDQYTKVEADYSVVTLKFDQSNWDQERTIEVFGMNDHITEGAVASYIDHEFAINATDPNAEPEDSPYYSALETSVNSISLVVYDDETPDYMVEEVADDNIDAVRTNEGFVSESGVTRRYRVTLTKELSAGEDVTIGVTSEYGEVSLDVSELLFVEGDTYKDVIVTANSDSDMEGFHLESLCFSVTSATEISAETEMLNESYDLAETPESFVALTYAPYDVDENGKSATLEVLVNSVAADPDVSGDEGTWVNLRDYNNYSYIVKGNKLIFTDANGNYMELDKKVDVSYERSIPKYTDLHDKRVSIDVVDDEAAQVQIIESDNSTDVVEDYTSGSGVLDTYDIVLTKQPTSDVTIRINPEAVAVRYATGLKGKTIEKGRKDVQQVTVSLIDKSTGEVLQEMDKEKGHLDLKISAENGSWNKRYTIQVSALEDSDIEYDELQSFAPELRSLHNIKGSLYIEGAGGKGAFVEGDATMLPHEGDGFKATGDIISHTDFEVSLRSNQILIENSEELRIEAKELLSKLSVEETVDGNTSYDGFEELLNFTITAAKGGRVGQFRKVEAIEEVTLDGKTLLLIDLNEAFENWNDVASFTLTDMSDNFFAIEEDQVDTLIINNQDSPLDDGSTSTLRDLDINDGLNVIDGTDLYNPIISRMYALDGMNLSGFGMAQDMILGGYKHTGGISYASFEAVEINLGSGKDKLNVESISGRTDGYKTWTVINSGDEIVDPESEERIGDTIEIGALTSEITETVLRSGNFEYTLQEMLAAAVVEHIDEDSKDLQALRFVFADGIRVDTTLNLTGYTLQFGNESVSQTRAITHTSVNDDGTEVTVHLNNAWSVIVDTDDSEEIVALDASQLKLFSAFKMNETLVSSDQPGNPANEESDKDNEIFTAGYEKTYPVGSENYAWDLILTATGFSKFEGELKGQVIEIIDELGDTVRRTVVAFDNENDRVAVDRAWEIDFHQKDKMFHIRILGETSGSLVVNSGAGDDLVNSDPDSTVDMILFGDSGKDTLKAGSGKNIIFGDGGKVEFRDENNKLVSYFGTEETAEKTVNGSFTDGVDRDALSFATLNNGVGGVDTITTQGGENFVFGGLGGDTILLENADGSDIAFGDNGSAELTLVDKNKVYTQWGDKSHTNILTAQSDINSEGGVDTIKTGNGDDIVIGGAETDYINMDKDGTPLGEDSGDDVVLGDNGVITYGILNGESRITSISSRGDNETGDTDYIYAGGGDNTIIGGVGGDKIDTGDDYGKDVVIGDNGEATFELSDKRLITKIATTDGHIGGDDTIITGEGENYVIAGYGADTVKAGLGRGRDVVLGDNGEANFDVTTGVELETFVKSNFAEFGGSDTIIVGDGDDIVIGGSGTDYINWDKDKDEAIGTDYGNDVILGDNGEIIYKLIGDDSRIETILSSAESDTGTIVDNDGSETRENFGETDYIYSGAGDNTVIGGMGGDKIYTGEGVSKDVVLGDYGYAKFDTEGERLVEEIRTTDYDKGGDDTIITGEGENYVIAGAGNDTVEAGEALGIDVVLGDNGYALFDTSTGVELATEVATLAPTEGGIDTITVGDGDDIVIGGAKTDYINMDKNGNIIGADLGNDVIVGDNGTITFKIVEGESRIRKITSEDDMYGDDDFIYAGGGDNTVIGGLGSDEIHTGDDIGKDVVLGDNGYALFDTDGVRLVEKITSTNPKDGGDDTIITGEGENYVIAGAGNDTVYAGETLGKDVVLGDNGYALFNTDSGVELVTEVATISPSEGGVDTITVGDGDDIVIGGAKTDHINMDKDGNITGTDLGDDVIVGDNGIITYDIVEGESRIRKITSEDDIYGDDDYIYSGGGDNTVIGGLGADRIHTGDDYGKDVVVGDNGYALFDTTGHRLISKISSTNPEDGAGDFIYTGEGENYVIGGAGSDYIDAGISAGKDVVVGDNGYAEFHTSTGDELPLYVTSSDTDYGAGDEIIVGAGDDIVIGGRGTDYINANPEDNGNSYEDDLDTGNDVIIGDNGYIDYAILNDESVIEHITNKGDKKGAGDVINALGGNDIVLGGNGDDTIDAGTGSGNDIVLGDNGYIDYDLETTGTQMFNEIASTDLDEGGSDQIIVGDGDDIVIGGKGSDYVNALRTTGEAHGDIDAGRDVVVGDNGLIDFKISYAGENYIRTIQTSENDRNIETDSNYSVIGDSDYIYTGGGDDVVIGGVGGDYIHAGDDTDSGQDFILGDNGIIHLELVNVPIVPGVTESQLLLHKALSVSMTTGGNDAIFTGGGNDVVIAGLGDDTVNYDAERGVGVGSTDIGNDVVIGDNGYVMPELMDDTQPMHEVVTDNTGQGGNDIIYTAGGKDIVIGGQGDDFINATGGGVDNDVVVGDDGRVQLQNVIDGYYTFDNVLHQAESLNWLSTHEGTDTIVTGGGSDVVIGGKGTDRIRAVGDQADASRNWIIGDNGRAAFLPGLKIQKLESLDDASIGAKDYIYTGNGHDSVIGGIGGDEIETNGGDDVVFGDGGYMSYTADGILKEFSNFNMIYGGGDNIKSGKGADIVFGGVGDDTINTGVDGVEDIVVGENAKVTFLNDELYGSIQVQDLGGSDTIVDDTTIDVEPLEWDQSNHYNYKLNDLVLNDGRVWKLHNVGFAHFEPSSNEGSWGWKEVTK